MSFYRTLFENEDLISKSRAVQELFVKIHLHIFMLHYVRKGAHHETCVTF